MESETEDQATEAPVDSIATLGSMFTQDPEAESTPDEAEEKRISPGEWLRQDDSTIVADFKTRAGTVKLAALTEKEVDNLLKAAKRPAQPGNPRAGTKTDMTMFRRLMIAYSLNKGSGLVDVNSGHMLPGAVTFQELGTAPKLSGELTTMFNKIAELSGYERQETTPLDLFG